MRSRAEHDNSVVLRWSVKSADNAGCRSEADSHRERTACSPLEAPWDSQAKSSHSSPSANGYTRSTLPSITTLREGWNCKALEDPARDWGVTLNGMPLPVVSYLDDSISVTMPDWVLLLIPPESHLLEILKWKLGEHTVSLTECWSESLLPSSGRGWTETL